MKAAYSPDVVVSSVDTLLSDEERERWAIAPNCTLPVLAAVSLSLGMFFGALAVEIVRTVSLTAVFARNVSTLISAPAAIAFIVVVAAVLAFWFTRKKSTPMSEMLHPLVRDRMIVIPKTLNREGMLVVAVMALTVFCMGLFVSAEAINVMIPVGFVGVFVIGRASDWVFIRPTEKHLATLGYSIT